MAMNLGLRQPQTVCLLVKATQKLLGNTSKIVRRHEETKENGPYEVLDRPQVPGL